MTKRPDTSAQTAKTEEHGNDHHHKVGIGSGPCHHKFSNGQECKCGGFTLAVDGSCGTDLGYFGPCGHDKSEHWDGTAP